MNFDSNVQIDTDPYVITAGGAARFEVTNPAGSPVVTANAMPAGADVTVAAGATVTIVSRDSLRLRTASGRQRVYVRAFSL